jgi:hypothetical protein
MTKINFKILFILILIVFTISFSQGGKGVRNLSVTKLPSVEKRWALIVGIDKYEKDISTLQGAVNDAKALKEVLVKYAGFPENQVIVLTSDSTDADEQPKKENILVALNDMISKVPEDGLLLFSFSGHGVSVGNQAYLVPSNGRITKNQTLLKNLAIDVSEIRNAIQEIKVKQVLMFLDACRNEPGKGDTPNVLTDAYKSGFSFDVVNSDVKAFATLYATTVGERAFEFYDKDSKQFRGYFSYAIEEALKGKAANEKGEITLSRLIDYLEKTVPQKVKLDKNEIQIPSTTVSETYRANELVLSVSQPQALQSNQINIKTGEVVYWNEIENSTEIEDFENYLSRTAKGEFSGTYKAVAELKINRLKKANADAWSKFRGTAKNLLIYDYVNKFSEGLAEAHLNNTVAYGTSGFINKSGNVVIPLKYDIANPFSNDLSLVMILDGTGYFGFVDRTGKEVIPRVKYETAESFSEGLAGVGLCEDGTFGFIDKNGKEVIPLKYDDVGSFAEGLAKVELNKKYGFIDKTGREIIAIKYDSIWCVAFVKEGFIGVILNGRKGFVDIYGNEYFDF